MLKKLFEKTQISQHDTIFSAINVLDRIASRILLVVDKEKKLLGTVTDGDVRRGLIHHKSIDAPVSEIMFQNPRTASINDDRQTILAMMKVHNLLQVPILNSEGIVVGLESLQQLITQPHYDNIVFLMAGGFGKRLRPLTNDTPKPLLEIGGKPILENILESFVRSGFHQFYISTHYKAEMVKKYFGDGTKWGVSISYVHEAEPLGTAGALGLLPHELVDKPLIVTNGDLLTKINYEHLMLYHDDLGGTATMCVREYDFQVPYGVVTTKNGNGQIEKIVEKPIHKFYVNAGIYVISPELHQTVEANVYIDMPDLLQGEIAKNEQVNMFPVHEYWLDIGCPEDYEKAQNMRGMRV